MKRLRDLLSSHRLQGLCLLIVGALLTANLLAPNVSAAVDQRLEAQRIEDLLARHQRILAAPARTNPYEAFETFVLRLDDDVREDHADSLLTELLTLLRRRQARVSDVRRTADDLSINGLVGLRIAATLEGDLEAMLATLVELSNARPTLVVESLELKPLRTNDRADRRLQATLTLVQWTGPPK